MIDLRCLAHTHVAVLGLGRTGTAAARALLASGVEVLAWDDDAARRTRVGDEIALTDLAGCDWSAVPLLVLSPGIPHTHPRPHPVVSAARSAGCEIVSDVELLVRYRPDARYIAITGTNGKSTTTSLVGHILARTGLAAAIGGNLGVPALGLPNLAPGGIYVLELSSYQLELTPSLACDVAVLLNISPDHLERHGGMVGYVAAKASVFRNQASGQTAIIGVDDDHCREIRAALDAQDGPTVVPIAVGRPAPDGVYVLDGTLYDDTGQQPEPVADLRAAANLPGAHNWQNAAAAFAAVRAIGLPVPAFVSALASFPGLAHRQETVAVVGGIKFVNDSKATNAEAAAKALACYDNVYWIAGGLAKQDGIAGLAPYFPRIKHAFLIGHAAEGFALILGGRVRNTICGELAPAVHAAYRRAANDRLPDPVVLLSPACASFDQFESFEARGDDFRQQVLAIAALAGGNDEPARRGGAA